MDFVKRLILEQGLMRGDVLEATVQEFRDQNRIPGLVEYVLVRGLLREDELLDAMAKRLGLEVVHDPEALLPDPELLESVPLDFCQQQRLLPLRVEDDLVVVACADPLDVHPLDDLKVRLGREIRAVIASPLKILDALDMVLESRDLTKEVLEDMEADATRRAEGGEEVDDIRDLAEKAPIVKLLNSYLFGAIQARASDIHVEPYEQSLRVRYRVDGRLSDCRPAPKSFQAPLISRIKILAGLDIAEDRLPQDGRMTITAGKRQMDIRVSTLPTAFGERVVMRLLDKSADVMDLESLGFSSDGLATFTELIKAPYGIFLVTGPTGSGKSTTLYSALQIIRSSDKNIITVEDPIENRIPEISQIQVKPEIGLTFAAGLRSILRQDPDIIMVGEIRDAETAEIAVHASLTGHLVFSTLHTNDSAGAISRLEDMGVEPYLISSSLIGIMAQRLVRLVCPDCRRTRPLEAAERQEHALSVESVSFGAGCETCRGSGYYNRVGIFEILRITEEIREMITAGSSSSKIKAHCLARGMTSLRRDGLRKVERGMTTLDEVLGITQAD